MPFLEDIFNPPSSYSLLTVGSSFAVGLIMGLIFKNRLIAKGKRKVLHLEDEMLSNHSRILSLQKQISDIKKEKEKRINGEDHTVSLRAS